MGMAKRNGRMGGKQSSQPLSLGHAEAAASGRPDARGGPREVWSAERAGLLLSTNVWRRRTPSL